ncbi:chaperone modulator CbpM [Trichothermofontia sichuanensis B231]|uniref:chaperone modulator CbpM n=1 Tax=Trichothermofontia sichuanensis TaxID=3045816 RepID=UPI0022470173|nr:chaperone modulator CbpM [Trichothermofontia sichuanensis]UZQ53783.1 chaperone modulator CbpM [Trichothermofontia sichuanensis B231]
MTTGLGLSQIVWSETGDRLYSFEQAAYFTQTSVPLLERFVVLGILEPTGIMLRRQDLIRVVQIQRLRRDLGLNLVGAAIVLDMATEMAQLKAQLRAYQKI